MKISSVVVSVPSFGDSFFISLDEKGNRRVKSLMFPSPHSGILFLWDAQTVAKAISGLMFPSPHSGILFL